MYSSTLKRCLTSGLNEQTLAVRGSIHLLQFRQLASSSEAAVAAPPAAAATINEASTSVLASTTGSNATSSTAAVEWAGAATGGWLWKGPKQLEKPAKSSWLWSRTGPDGKTRSMATWEKLYWGVGVMGISLFLLPRMQHWTQKDDVEAKRRAKEDLAKRRVSLLPVMLAGKSFLDEEGPGGGPRGVFDGLSPREINQLAVQRWGSAVVKDDPFEGLSPEEIDALWAGQEASATTPTDST